MKIKSSHLLITLWLVAVFNLNVKAQYPRKILFEQFTNEGCAPCVQANLDLDLFMQQNPDDYTCIKYHVGFPSPTDPFFVANPIDATQRFSYYNLIGLAALVADGNFYTGYSSPPYSTFFFPRLQTPSPFQITTTFIPIDNPGTLNDSVYLSTTVKAGINIINNNLKLRSAIIEKYVSATSPGNFTYFRNPVHKLVPDTNGTLLPSVFLQGDSVVISTATSLSSVTDFRQLAVVSFIQDDSTKEVMQSANGISDPVFSITPPHTFKMQELVNINDSATFKIPFRIKTSKAAHFSFIANSNSLPNWNQSIAINGISSQDSIGIFFPALTDTVIDFNLSAIAANIQCSQYDLSFYIRNDSMPDSYLNFNSNSLDYFFLTAFSKCTNFVLYNCCISTILSQSNSVTPLPSRLDTVNFNKWSIKNLFVSYHYDTLREALPLMINFLNSGGNVYLEGDAMSAHVFSAATPQNVKDFYHNYMGADYLYTNTNQTVTINAVPNDIFYGTLPVAGPMLAGIMPVLKPYALTPNSVPILCYNNDTTMALGIRNTDGNFKTVLVAGYPTGIYYNSSVPYQFAMYTNNWFNSVSTGIADDKEETTANNFQAFPNPAYDKVWIKVGAAASERQIVIFDMLGRNVGEYRIPKLLEYLELNLSALQQGIYIYKVCDGNHLLHSQKLVVNRK